MDKLFLLKPGFADEKLAQDDRLYYCPSCAAIEGVLAYYPALRTQLEISYVDFAKPRKLIVELVGEAYQSCPLLVLDTESGENEKFKFIKKANGRLFITTSAAIMEYLAYTYSIAYPHP